MARWFQCTVEMLTNGHRSHWYACTMGNPGALGSRLPSDLTENLRKYNSSGLEVINVSTVSDSGKIKRNDWLLADTCPQAAYHCALL